MQTLADASWTLSPAEQTRWTELTGARRRSDRFRGGVRESKIMAFKITRIFVVCGLLGTVPGSPVHAADTKFFDDGSLALVAATRPKIAEPTQPVFLNGALVGGGNYNVIEAYDKVTGTTSFPLTVAHIIANTFERFTYQKPDGTSGALGSSIISTPSFWTSAGLQLVPQIDRVDVSTGTPDRYRVATQAHFATAAGITTTVGFPDPPIGQSTASLDVAFTALGNITLASGSAFVANDRFRVMSVSSMFASLSQYDANLIRYQDAAGHIGTFSLTDGTPRDAHLFATPIELGSWFELIKTPGSTWFPDSPSIHISIINNGGLRLGLQGFLADSTNPNDDSLSLWAEWLDAPDVIMSGTGFSASFVVIALAVPEPASSLMLLVGVLALGVARKQRA